MIHWFDNPEAACKHCGISGLEMLTEANAQCPGFKIVEDEHAKFCRCDAKCGPEKGIKGKTPLECKPICMCRGCGLFYDGEAVHFCTGKPTPEPHLAAAYGDTDVWDRLRADLSNLGAYYGPAAAPLDLKSYVYEPGSDTLTEIRDEDFSTEPFTVTDVSTTSFTGIDFEPGMTYEIHAYGKVYEYTHPEADYDALILAARRKREAGNRREIREDSLGHLWGFNVQACERCHLTATEYAEWLLDDDPRNPTPTCDQWAALKAQSSTVSAAMSRPLDWEPRVGWKGRPLDAE